jgi:hypothetical protein
VRLVAPHKATNIDEIRKIGLLVAAPYTTTDNIVTVGFRPDAFVFVVETAGGLAPDQIVASALRRLIDRLRTMQLAVEEAATTAASGAFGGGGGFRGAAGVALASAAGR